LRTTTSFTVAPSNGGELPKVRRELLLAHRRYCALDCDQTVGVVKVHALGAFDIEETP
jgi:hypothetical protein